MRNLDETVRPMPGKKNTKKWCKGVVDRAHAWKWEDHFALKYPALVDEPEEPWFLVQVCRICGKHGKMSCVRSSKSWREDYDAFLMGS